MRRLAAVLVAVVALLVPVVAVTSLSHPTPAEWEMVRWVNGERAWAGLPPLLADGPLTGQAQLHAARMAATGQFQHSPWEERNWWLLQGWTSIGENIAVGPSGTTRELFALHQALVASPPHLANILGHYKGMGIATARGTDGRTYVTQVFGDCVC